MSANYPPPQQPGGQNPYGPPQPGQPQSPYGASPYAGGQPGAPAPGGFNAGAYAPPAPVGMAPEQKNPGVAILAGVAVMLVAALAYAGLMRAMSKDDGSYTEISYIALAVGLLVGLVVGKLGGRNPALPVVAGLLSVLGVFLGEFVGYSMIISHVLSAHDLGDMSWFKILTDHTSDVWKFYKHDFDFKSFLFLALSGVVGFVTTKRVSS
ncbi:DUF1427 family protein [Streptomyces sp. NRRL F-5123]|uniref:DUF1427 family protein n=1 Tax=Streptomyces sp. NRRL F-5123 TaxID=1463856 RepID=UPI0004E1EA88|nr:DUF1427 family protein [Streptomyces sp. NRRL F-5123]